MLKSSPSVIRLRGVRHNNLKNFDLDLPLNQLIVVTGLSGSGKSSLAFDTLFAEGQRRYIETFSPYARQFFDRMDKPQVDSIEGIPPAIAIEQRNAVKTTRSTVGTMTEICDYMKMLWPHIAQLHCRQCGQPVRKDSPQQIWEMVNTKRGGSMKEPKSEKCRSPNHLRSAAFGKTFPRRIARPGRQTRLPAPAVGRGEIVRLDEALTHHASRITHQLTYRRSRPPQALARQPRPFRRSLRTSLSFRQRQTGDSRTCLGSFAPHPSTQRNASLLQPPPLRPMRHRIPRAVPCPVQLQSSGRRVPDVQRLWPHHHD